MHIDLYKRPVFRQRHGLKSSVETPLLQPTRSSSRYQFSIFSLTPPLLGRFFLLFVLFHLYVAFLNAHNLWTDIAIIFYPEFTFLTPKRPISLTILSLTFFQWYLLSKNILMKSIDILEQLSINVHLVFTLDCNT